MRGVGLLEDIPDIERIVLKAKDGSPVYVRDVAEVVIGAEPRQGAVSRDGKGEAVAGMIIMLKGENSQRSSSRVGEVGEIQSTLPEACGSTCSTTAPAHRGALTRCSTRCGGRHPRDPGALPVPAECAPRSSSSSRCHSLSW
jgi:hypothetical protein